MQSKIAKCLKLRYEPVAILCSDEKPADALGFKGCKGGCVMVLFAQAAAKGRSAAFDRENFGCFGGGAGLGFGRQYENFPFGGIETFKYFLSTGLEGQQRDDLVKKICSQGSREQVENFLKELPSMEVSKRYVVFKPLKELAEEEEPVVVVFLADADQISALIGLANYDRQGVENVFAPMGAGCHQIGIYAFREAQMEKNVEGSFLERRTWRSLAQDMEI